jgi:GTP cyclohydrolase I
MDELSGSLRRLQSQQAAESEDFTLTEEGQISPKRSVSRDGYGFRKSGISTPIIPASTPDGPQHTHLADGLVPDPNGLGWPGVFLLTLQQ